MAHSPRARSNASRAASAARASSGFCKAFAVCYCIRNASDGLAKQQKPEPAGADVERNRYQSWRNTFQSRSTRHTATGPAGDRRSGAPHLTAARRCTSDVGAASEGAADTACKGSGGGVGLPREGQLVQPRARVAQAHVER